MKKELIIPEFLWEKVSGFPESSYGVNKVKLVLKNGSIVPGIYLAWGNEICKTENNMEIDFTVDDVIDVINDK